MNAREANQDTSNSVEHVTIIIRARQQMKEVGPEVF